jgi:type IV secretory pathway ATPase VirB11/archaellum biosynthesis ATPase
MSDRRRPAAAQGQPQILLVLCGVVGSGKTTLANAILDHEVNWVRVCQDDLGNRIACEQLVRKSLRQVCETHV